MENEVEVEMLPIEAEAENKEEKALLDKMAALEEEIIYEMDNINEEEEVVESVKKPMFGFGYDIQLNEDGTVKIPDKSLTMDIIRTGLSHVSRTVDTFEFAYSRYDGRNKNLTNIDVLGQYVHLRTIDISGNHIESCKALANVKHLLVLIVSENKLKSLEEIPELPFLQALNVKGNGLTNSSGLFPNSLAYLQLSSNKLEELVDFNADIFPWLAVLELRGNNLKTLKGLRLPTLARLFVADNELSNLDGLKGCPNLTHLHARDNKISQLEKFPNLEHLDYVNLRNNSLTRFTQTSHLGNSPNIRTLIAMENPISTLENYKLEMIATNLNLRRLDKEPITEIDLVEGRKLRSGRDKGVLPPIEDDPGLITPPISSIADDTEEDDEHEVAEEGDDELEGSDEILSSEVPDEVLETDTENYTKKEERKSLNIELKEL